MVGGELYSKSPYLEDQEWYRKHISKSFIPWTYDIEMLNNTSRNAPYGSTETGMIDLKQICSELSAKRIHITLCRYSTSTRCITHFLACLNRFFKYSLSSFV